MKLLIVSDFHIGPDKETEVFGWKSKRFLREISELREKYNIDKIVLNGDIYELYHNTFSEVFFNNQKVVSYLNSEEFVYLKGNHDAVNNFGSYSFDFTNSKGKKIHIEHGHDADFLCGTRIGRTIGRVSFHILKQLLRFETCKKIYFRFIEKLDNVDRIPKKYDSYKYLTYALNLLKMYDLVVLGHTHKMEVHKTYYLNQKKTYINCGTCSLGRLQAVVLDTETLKYKTIKISKGEIKKKNKIRKQRNDLENRVEEELMIAD